MMLLFECGWELITLGKVCCYFDFFPFIFKKVHSRNAEMHLCVNVSGLWFYLNKEQFGDDPTILVSTRIVHKK